MTEISGNDKRVGPQEDVHPRVEISSVSDFSSLNQQTQSLNIFPMAALEVCPSGLPLRKNLLISYEGCS